MAEKNTRIIALSALAFTIFAIAAYTAFAVFIADRSRAVIYINDKPVRVGIADNDPLRYRGLSGVAKLCEDCGMLFVFDGKGEREFVMRDMGFPLDIVWIDGSSVVKIDKNLPPEGSAPRTIYGSGQPVDLVLEVNGGFADKNGIKIGDKIKQ